MTSFGVIGSGWRCEFFLRLARMAPDRLRAAGVVTRTADRGTEVTATWGVPTFRRAAELLAEAPDFVIASTPWAVTPDTTRGEGPEPYPLAEGLQDHLISVAIGESLATGRDVTTTTEAWAR